MAAGRVILCLACVLAPSSARADDPDVVRTGLVDGFDLKTYVGSEFLMGQIGDLDMYRISGTVGAEVRIHPRLSLFTEVYVGHTSISYDNRWDDELAVRAEFSTGVDVGLGAGLNLVIVEDSWFILEGYLTIATSPWNTRMDLKEIELDTAQGSFYLSSYASQHATVNHSWHRIRTGMTARFPVGIFVPKFTLGIERYYGGFDVRLDADSRELLSDLGYDYHVVERSRHVEHVAPLLAPGLDLDLADAFTLSVGGLVIPVSGKWIFGGDLSLSLHL